MLAYRHAFHAGNHGDVLKHVVLVSVLRYMTGKAAPMAMVDTHAGAGGYALDGRYAARTAEAGDGIGGLWHHARRPGDGGRQTQADADKPVPAALLDYLDIVQRFNPPGRLEQYPGSPAIALALLRPGDSLALYERHPTDERLLRGLVATQASAGVRARVHLGDGFESPGRELPPPPRRGLVLIDPSYEMAPDYTRTVATARECLKRFASGTVIIWYPRLQTVESRQLPRRLLASAAAAPKGWLHATLTVARSDRNGFGLTGSGVVVFNPPYPLAEQMRAALPHVVEALGRTPDARSTVDTGDAAMGNAQKDRGR